MPHIWVKIPPTSFTFLCNCTEFYTCLYAKEFPILNIFNLCIKYSKSGFTSQHIAIYGKTQTRHLSDALLLLFWNVFFIIMCICVLVLYKTMLAILLHGIWKIAFNYKYSFVWPVVTSSQLLLFLFLCLSLSLSTSLCFYLLYEREVFVIREY